MTTDADPVVVDYARRFPESFARVLGQGDDAGITELIHTLPPESIASVVSRLPAARLLALLESDRHSPETWLQDAPFDDAVMLLARMRRERRLALIESISDRARQRALLQIERFPPHSAGSLVQDVLLRIDIDRSPETVAEELRNNDDDDLPALVVVDSNGRYAGMLDPWRLMSRRYSGRQLGELIDEVQPVAPESTIVAAAAHAGWNTRNWLPVVDHRQRVLGVLSRERTLRAASKQSSGTTRSNSLLLDLAGDLSVLLGDAIDAVLAKPSP